MLSWATDVIVVMPVKGAGPRRRGNLVRGNLRCNSRWQSRGEAVQGDLSKPVVERGKVPVDFVAKLAQGTCLPPERETCVVSTCTANSRVPQVLDLAVDTKNHKITQL